jgi:hypothetical protein
MTVHAVETTCPVVAKVSSATLAAGSPNLDHQWWTQKNKKLLTYLPTYSPLAPYLYINHLHVSTQQVETNNVFLFQFCDIIEVVIIPKTL